MDINALGGRMKAILDTEAKVNAVVKFSDKNQVLREFDVSFVKFADGTTVQPLGKWWRKSTGMERRMK